MLLIAGLVNQCREKLNMKMFLLGLKPFYVGCATVSNEVVIDATPERFGLC